MSSRWARLTAIVVLVAAAIGTALALRGGREFPVEFERSISSSATGLARLQLSEDGRLLFAAGGDGSVVHWLMPGTGSGEILSPTGSVPVTVLGLTPDSLLLAGDLSGRLRLWELPSLKPLEIESPAVPVTCVAFREVAGRKQLFLGMAEGRIVTVDDQGATPRVSGHRGVKALALNKEGTVLISGGSEGDLIWYDLQEQQQQQIARQKTHSAEISVVLLSPGGDAVISADWDGHVRVTSTATREVIATFSQPDAVSALAVHGEVIITGSWDRRVRVWEIKGDAGTLKSEFDTGAAVLGLAVTADGKTAMTVCGTRSVDFWKLP
ncbi:MAG: WD40 repeat domain-containing protein [Planctomycetota bacterium]|nr:WD40 repeat domain-containing protein [Planctomycetota bacterium]MDA1247844.1 WD40 repeat domain-containing protein [Planctomycetota bacterium]